MLVQPARLPLRFGFEFDCDQLFDQHKVGLRLDDEPYRPSLRVGACGPDGLMETFRDATGQRRVGRPLAKEDRHLECSGSRRDVEERPFTATDLEHPRCVLAVPPPLAGGPVVQRRHCLVRRMRTTKELP